MVTYRKPGNATAPILWRRLDLPGRDAACVQPDPEGSVLSGMAVFHEGGPTALTYVIHADGDWITTEGQCGAGAGGN